MTFPYRSASGTVEGKANKKTGTACPIPAREKPIWFSYGEVNRVRRIGAFSWGKTKKLPWDDAIAAELAICLPAKAEARKEDRSLVVVTRTAKNGCRGCLLLARDFPHPPTPRWMARGYLRQTPCHRRRRPTGFSVKGRRDLTGFLEVPDPVSQVNTAESAIWESAYHVSGDMAHSGKRNCARNPHNPTPTKGTDRVKAMLDRCDSALRRIFSGET